MEKTEAVIDQLIGYFHRRGCDAAATCLRRAKIGMFGYIRRWLEWGLISPRASSMVEKVMRELGRRIKKIAHGWSDRGVTKVARIILKRFADAGAGVPASAIFPAEERPHTATYPGGTALAPSCSASSRER